MVDGTVNPGGEEANHKPDPWRPDTLRGSVTELLPLAPAHHDGLCEAVRDGRLWELWYTRIPSPEAMRAEIERRLTLAAAGSMIPFTVVERSTGQIAGMTTYMNIDCGVPRVEIGSTWYRAGVQRTALNTECKLLLLTHAFGALGCAAVEFRTHILNTQSRRAIERLGAHLDGTLRSHARMPDGTLRDTVVYSILASEWPAIRTHLEWQMRRTRPPVSVERPA